MNDATQIPDRDDGTRVFDVTVRFAQHADGRVEYWTFPADRFGAESDEELARLWFQGAPFALIGAHVLQRRLLAHGIVRALDEANGFVRRLNALAQQGAEPPATGTGAHPESGAVH